MVAALALVIRDQMPALTPNEIESELSYAYLHAVASDCGYSCSYSSRHEDNMGIDATVRAVGPFSEGVLTDVTLDVQLKATTTEPGGDEVHVRYFLHGIERYNALRKERRSVPRILVVLFLPKERADWLRHSEDDLRLLKCAYWVSLVGAPESSNESGVTIDIPRAQKFERKQLETLIARISRFDIIRYNQ
jgi:Domain of unknown function (DUF4365)